jgi:hypothetical protein
MPEGHDRCLYIVKDAWGGDHGPFELREICEALGHGTLGLRPRSSASASNGRWSRGRLMVIVSRLMRCIVDSGCRHFSRNLTAARRSLDDHDDTMLRWASAASFWGVEPS